MKNLLRQCQICTRFNGRPYGAPESPPMPPFHTEECPPFSYVEVDYAGALYIKEAGEI